MIGKLILVGAGPGDPDLITLKAIKAIKNGEVILYDALVNPELLEYADQNAEIIFVGKRSGKHSLKQDEINELIVQYALKGKDVVRLKGGDPLIFARGKEEIDYASAYGIPYEVVVGISSLNLPGYYGIPLTSRGINESFWVVTATTKTGDLSSDIKLVAQSNATAVVYMGLKKLDKIAALYASFGKENLPVAIISNGSLPHGKIISGRISDITERYAENPVPAPALLVIGEVVESYEHFSKSLVAVAHA
ncbi:MAG: uroporphyrinogen-III C-methyltransferase [Cyclobacteriaceae bacterium]